jgi:peptide/nickel transport system substrate-binding protein
MFKRAMGLLTVLVVVTACTSPQAAPGQTAGGSQGSQPQVTSQGPKLLTWAVQQEPSDVAALSGLGGTRGPVSAFRQLAHAQLVKDDYTISPFAEMATELPSVEKGTWKLNPDGTMQTTWKLKPNIKWHDGVPLTSADLVFWLTVLKDDAFPSANLIGLEQIASVSAPDAQTFVLNWSSPHYRANRIPEFGPVPKHILESVYAQKDPEALLNHRYFTTEFVGLGAYKLSRWDQGSRMELTRFDDYFQGRPKIDRIVLQFIPDFNTMFSNAMAGSVDVASPPGEAMDVAMNLKRQWEGTGHRVRTDPNDRIRLVYIQLRPEYARPANTMTNPLVRQALYHAIDRPSMAQVITEGLSPVADSWYAPNSPLRKEVESAIPQYPFDLNRSQQLLTQAGWVRGTDGILANQASGERFQMDFRFRPGSATERETLVLADYWKAVGVSATVTPPAPNLVNDREWLATYPGIQISRLETEDAFNTRRLHTRAVAGPANRWAGRNGAGYSNLQADDIQDKLVVTIDPREQVNLHRQLVQVILGEAGVMPLYWDVELALAMKQVKGDVTATETGWNVFTWDKE